MTVALYGDSEFSASIHTMHKLTYTKLQKFGSVFCQCEALGTDLPVEPMIPHYTTKSAGNVRGVFKKFCMSIC